MPFGSATANAERELIVRTTSAMASFIEVLIDGSNSEGDRALKLVDDVFARYEMACSRFAEESELNCFLRGRRSQSLSLTLGTVLRDAYAAYVETNGRFDPRVRKVLEDLGYDVTYSALREPDVAPEPQPIVVPWGNPLKNGAGFIGVVQDQSLDLGGIAKGAALRAARDALNLAGLEGLVCAGGDVVVATRSEHRPWPIAIEDPIPHAVDPIATIELRVGAVMTSSVRLRQWRAGTTPVHHLIDPRTGAPGGNGLASVTVIGADPVVAEVWSKTLFLAGFNQGLAEAEDRQLAAIFVSREGDFAVSEHGPPLVTWVRPS